MRNRTDLKYRIIVGIFLSFLLLPLITILIWAFTKRWPWPDLIPTDFGLRGWAYLLDPRSNSLANLLYSILLSLVVSILTLIITVPAAKALVHYDFKFKKQIEILTFLPIIVPSLTVAMGIHLQFIRMGIANTFIGVVLIHIIPCIPYSLRILQSVFNIIGNQMENQARVLGASPLQTLLYVMLPMLLPGMISAGGMVFIVSFSQYFLTMLIGGGRIITFPMVMFPFIQSGDRMLGAVYSMVFILTTLVILIIVEKIMKKFYGERLKGYTYV